MSVFFCDTNCEIDLDRLRSLNINLIKMPYTLNGKEFYYDLGENTDLTAFFAAMRKGASVKTQALNTYDYIEYLEPVLSRGEDIVYVSFSHKMSGTFQSLDKAIAELKEKYPDRSITVFDTKSISQGAGMIVAAAGEAHARGEDDGAVLAEAQRVSEKSAIYFTVENLEYLRRGGRLSKFKSFMGTLFNVKPIITAVEGALVNTETAKGRKAALKRLVNIFEQDGDLSYPVRILHADCKIDCDMVVDMIKEKLPNAVVETQEIGPVVGCHCGPGTVGIAFLKK